MANSPAPPRPALINQSRNPGIKDTEPAVESKSKMDSLEAVDASYRSYWSLVGSIYDVVRYTGVPVEHFLLGSTTCDLRRQPKTHWHGRQQAGGQAGGARSSVSASRGGPVR